MNELKRNLQEYRNQLARALDANLGKDDPFAQGVASVTRALVSDFDRIFNPSILKANKEKLQPLIEEYCHPDKDLCPLCGSKIIRKTSKKSFFKGCSRFPTCHGARHMSGEPSINDALRFFLTAKVKEETLREELHRDARFRNLDL